MENIKSFNLANTIKAYLPFDEIEESHLSKLKDFLQNDSNVFSRTNLSGHVNGSGFLFNSDLSKVLLTHHAKLNEWFQFGGHSDGEENTFNVALRETIEESGIKNIKPLLPEIFDIDVHQIPENVKKQEPAHYHYDIRFTFVTEDENFQISNESNQLKWFTLEDFKNLRQTSDNVRFYKKWEVLQNKL